MTEHVQFEHFTANPFHKNQRIPRGVFAKFRGLHSRDTPHYDYILQSGLPVGIKRCNYKLLPLLKVDRPQFYQTRSAWSMDQGSTKKRSAVHNVVPTVTKFCVMWEGLSLPHDTKFGDCRGEIVDKRVIFSWSLIHGSSWSGLIKLGPGFMIFVRHGCEWINSFQWIFALTVLRSQLYRHNDICWRYGVGHLITVGSRCIFHIAKSYLRFCKSLL